MKKQILLLLICFSGLASLAQESTFSHSLSLNFSGGFPQRFNTTRPQEILSPWLPGLEYRFHLTDRVQLRAGLSYSLPQTYTFGEPGRGSISRGIVSSRAMQVGGQFHFWPTSFLQNFQTYGFAELGVAHAADTFYTFNPANIPLERTTTSSLRVLGLSLGLGLSYWFGQRWVVRFESAYAFSWNAREMTSDSGQLVLPPSPNIEDGIIRYSSHSLIPISEVSIGWRF